MEKIKLGFMPMSRNVFSRDWAIDMKKRTLKVLSDTNNIQVISPTNEITKDGLIENESDALKTINLFSESKIDALLIGTMNFGEELAAMTIIEAFKDKPMSLFGTKEGPVAENGKRNSDSFCGTLSISSALHRRNIDFNFLGIVFPEEEKFIKQIDILNRSVFAIKNFKYSRIGLIGPRPYPFETCTINEANLVNKFGIRVNPISLISISKKIERIKDNDDEVRNTLNEILLKADCSQIKNSNLIRLIKLEKVIKNIIKENDLSAIAFSCWPDFPEIFGVSPCLALSRLTESGTPASCEADVYGTITMLIQYLVSLKKNVPHFIDWTIQNQEEENKFLSWHCGNAPMCLAGSGEKVRIRNNLYGADTKEGTVEFKLKEGTVSLNSLVEYNGNFKMLITKGIVQNDSSKMRGSWCWVKVDGLEKLYNKLVLEGFVHHASMIYDDYSDSIDNFCNYLGIDKVTI